MSRFGTRRRSAQAFETKPKRNVDKHRILETAQAQFEATAANYVDSPRHAGGADLRRLVELGALRGDERVLDIATGAGHTALAFAPHVAEVVATDLTPRMLELAAALATKRGIHNVRFVQAHAESLPFSAQSFEVVTCRIAPHHFADPNAFVRETARVLVPGGHFLLEDQTAPDDPELDEFVNHFERWRDPSHVRAYTAKQWRAWIEQAGMFVETVEAVDKGSYDFADWTARSRLPDSERDALERWLLAAPARCAEFFHIECSDGRIRSLRACFSIIAARRREV
jgi:ubiquinone/menaquinone biosynthesis C-methylase UbiE